VHFTEKMQKDGFWRWLHQLCADGNNQLVVSYKWTFMQIWALQTSVDQIQGVHKSDPIKAKSQMCYTHVSSMVMCTSMKYICTLFSCKAYYWRWIHHTQNWIHHTQNCLKLLYNTIIADAKIKVINSDNFFFQVLVIGKLSVISFIPIITTTIITTGLIQLCNCPTCCICWH